jgi:copper resistance protein D
VNPDGIAVAARALALLCLYQSAGAVFFLALFERELPHGHARARVRRLARIAALCAMVLVALLAPLMAARMAGDLSGLFNGALLRVAWHSSNAMAQAVQLLGLILIVIGLPAIKPVAVLGAVLACCALVLTGHTSVNPQRALLAPLLTVHLLIVAFWFGALAPLWLALRHETLPDAAALLQRFSRLAAWLVPGIALAGVSMAFVLIDDVAVLHRPYGELLLAKLCVYILLMGLAAMNRWRFTPALNAAPQSARRALQRSLVAEYLGIALVLAMTATLTTLFSPDD